MKEYNISVLVATWIVYTMTFFAPAPNYKPEPPTGMEVTPGGWFMKWGSIDLAMGLTKDGVYSWGNSWKGNYSWDAKSRTFSVSESTDGVSFSVWTAVLDENGKGTVKGAFEGTIIHVYKGNSIEQLKRPKVTD